MMLPITLTIAGAAALIHLWLAMRVSQARRQYDVSVGDGGNPRLLARIRAHGNFTESAPIVLILLGLVEAATGSDTGLWLAGIAFILARLAHPFGMERPAPNALRLVGILVTWLVLLGLAAYALALPYLERRPAAPVSYAASSVQAPAST